MEADKAPMEVDKALQIVSDRTGLTATKIAAKVDVREKTATKWMSGESQPRLAQYQRLRSEIPLFADLMDGKVAA